MILIPFTSGRISARFFDAILIYLGQEKADGDAIESEFQEWSKRNPSPPNIIIVGPREHLLALSQEDDPVWQQQLSRHAKVSFASVLPDGSLQTVAGTTLKDDFERAVRAYIESTLSEGQVVIPAPPGFLFEKLSKRYSSHFLKAEALLTSSASIDLLASGLLRYFSSWLKPHQALPVVRIYIDTMAIWPIAFRMCQLASTDSFSDDRFEIQSFRSYEGLEKWKPPQAPSFVIISASTANRLLEEVLAKFPGKGVGSATLLLLEDDSSAVEAAEPIVQGFSLFTVPRRISGRASLDGVRELFNPNIEIIPSGEEIIKIVGERFISHHAKPRPVRIIHTCLEQAQKNELKRLAFERVMRVAVAATDHRRYMFFPDLTELVDDLTKHQANGDSKLKSALQNFGFAGPAAVVYPSGVEAAPPEYSREARRLAESACAILAGFGAKVGSPISSIDLSKMEKDIGDRAVLVIAPLIGDGFLFKSISADLRRVHVSGPRLYLAGLALPRTQMVSDILRKDLEASGGAGSYRLHQLSCIPVGKVDETQWRDEIDLLKGVCTALTGTNEGAPPRFLARLEKLSREQALRGDEVFLCSAQGDPLMLTRGFALWPEHSKLDLGDATSLQAGVLLSVAAALQASRHGRRAAETSLNAGQFVQTVLGPMETFTRYNDSVIQASFLRAAYPSELDYRAMENESGELSKFICKLIDLVDAPAGAALPEFLLALVLQRVRLRRDHTKLVKEATEQIDHTWLKVLGQAIPL
jgi:hypothetical protein